MQIIKKKLLQYEPRGMIPNFGTFWSRAKNSNVYDSNNKKYIDCYDICKPAFFIDYMNDKLFNNISNLILVQF